MTFHFFALSKRCRPNNLKALLIFIRGISKSYYDILNISPTCSSREIRDAFIYLSKQNHPDKHLNDPSMHEKFVEINEAYSTLINPSSRRSYDLSLSHKRKLEPPYDIPYTTTKNSTHSSEKFHRTQSGRDYYGEYVWPHGRQPNSSRNQFVTWMQWFEAIRQGRPFSKRLSSSMFVVLLISFTFVAVLIEVMFFRHAFQSIQEKMLEKTREVNMMHSLARENANFYGEAHQIEKLKKALKFDSDIKEGHIAKNKKETPLQHSEDEAECIYLPPKSVKIDSSKQLSNDVGNKAPKVLTKSNAVKSEQRRSKCSVHGDGADLMKGKRQDNHSPVSAEGNRTALREPNKGGAVTCKKCKKYKTKPDIQ